MKKLLYLSMFLWLVLTGCTQEKKEFTVLQWNIWQEGTMVPGGYEAIVDEIIRLRPDFVTLSEGVIIITPILQHASPGR